MLNDTHDISAAGCWNDRSRSDLWLYNLHYFDDLNSIDSDLRHSWHASLVKRWIDENPVGQGIGWHPYPISRRVINWIKWMIRSDEAGGAELHSLAMQCRWLADDLEFHIGGNHLLANAKALIFAGVFFGGQEGDNWLHRGLEILASEIHEQILTDGGHYERSPMYHAAVLEDLLDTMNVIQAYGLGHLSWRERVVDMLRWLRVMSHPDGRVAFFNDSAFDIAPDFAQLASYAQRLGLPAIEVTDDFCILQPSGYVRIQQGAAWLACDCAPVGPDHLPAHAHADTLSFELSLGGRRLLVNSGTSVYGTGSERQRQRGTAAHNTVSVDGQDSSEVWAGFRVARRAHCQLVSARVADQTSLVEASHDGFQRLAGRNTHVRRWQLDDGELRIDDRITGHFNSAVAYFHLHPAAKLIETSDSNEYRITLGGAEVRLSFSGAREVTADQCTWHPGFGVSEPNYRIAVALAGHELSSRLSWRVA